MPALSIVIPAFNEAARLPKTLEALAGYLAGLGEDAEVIVVDDGSTDGTTALVGEWSDRFADLRVMGYPDNRGKGYAVRMGMLAASGDERLFMDADGATPIEELEKLKAKMHSRGGRCSMAIASIGLPESEIEIHQSAFREMTGRAANLLIRLLAVSGIKDTQRGFKLMTADVCEAVFPRCRINGWAFDVEVLAVARRLGYDIAEVPVRWRHDPDSRVTAGSYLTTLGELLRIRWGLWTRKYK